jgi:hypothetical protein
MAGRASKSRNAALLLGLTFALAMLGARTWIQVWLLGSGMATCFGYGFSGWATKKGLSVAERIGRWMALSLVVLCGVVFYGQQFRPGCT